MTLDEANQLQENDLIECLYQGRIWVRSNFVKLEGRKILRDNGALADLDECRLIPIEEKHLESFGLKSSEFKYVHELVRYCKENNIEGKGWK